MLKTSYINHFLISLFSTMFNKFTMHNDYIKAKIEAEGRDNASVKYWTYSSSFKAIGAP